MQQTTYYEEQTHTFSTYSNYWNLCFVSPDMRSSLGKLLPRAYYTLIYMAPSMIHELSYKNFPYNQWIHYKTPGYNIFFGVIVVSSIIIPPIKQFVFQNLMIVCSSYWKSLYRYYSIHEALMRDKAITLIFIPKTVIYIFLFLLFRGLICHCEGNHHHGSMVSERVSRQAQGALKV